MSALLTAAEATACAVAASPGVRIAADTEFRRLFGRRHAQVAALLAAWAVVVALAALLAPVLLHALAAISLAGFVAATVRARPGHGRRRRLPPGSLSISQSVQGLADRRFYLERARRHGPVFKAAQFHRGIVCVVGLERGHRLLAEHAAAIGSSPLPLTEDVTGGFVRYMDDATYARYGPLLRRAQTRPVTARSEPVMEAAARRELRRMAEDAAASGGRPLAPAPYFARIVHESFMAALFGIERGSETWRRFEALYAPIAAHDIAQPLPDDARRALAALRELLAAHADRLGAEGGTPSCSLAELRAIDPGQPDAVCLDNLVLTLKIASANVVSLLHWLTEMAAVHPDCVARLRDGGGERRDAIDRFVMETLRLHQSEYLYRVLTDDVDFEGFRLPGGWLLRVCVWESHRDPGVFDDPERFDPDRFAEPAFTASGYSPFGRGAHACNGIPLAKSIARAVFEALAQDFDCEIVPGGPPARDFRHWSHWRPGAALALRPWPREREADALPDAQSALAASASAATAPVDQASAADVSRRSSP